MPQVSRFKLTKQAWEKVFDMLLLGFQSPRNKGDMRSFVYDLFTPTERIMFAKRFAACVLLAKGNGYKTVARTLRMSAGTIAKMNTKVQYGGESLKKAIEEVFLKQANEIFKEELLGTVVDMPTKGSYKSPARYKRKVEREKKINEIKATF